MCNVYVCVRVSDFQSGQDLLIEQMFHWNVAASAGPFMWYNQLINSFLYPSWLIRRNSLISLISQLRRIQESIFNHNIRTIIIFGQNDLQTINVCLWWCEIVMTWQSPYIILHFICILWHRSSVTRCLYYSIVISKHIILWIIHQCFSLS